MLKTLSLLPEGGRDVEEDDTNNSESRMLRALEALSNPQSHAAPSSAPQPAQRDEGVFRQNRQQRDGHREQQRDQASMHQQRGRHRFVKDGEVPVVHVAANRPRDVVAPQGVRGDAEHARLQQALEEQRLRGDLAERAKSEMQLQLRLLQTKCAHAEMAANDSAALAEARLQDIIQLQEQLRQVTAARPEPKQAEPKQAEAKAAEPKSSEPLTFTVAEDGFAADTLFPMPAAERPARGKIVAKRRIKAEPETVATEEPEPVQWWLAPPKAPAKRARR